MAISRRASEAQPLQTRHRHSAAGSSVQHPRLVVLDHGRRGCLRPADRDAAVRRRNQSGHKAADYARGDRSKRAGRLPPLPDVLRNLRPTLIIFRFLHPWDRRTRVSRDRGAEILGPLPPDRLAQLRHRFGARLDVRRWYAHRPRKPYATPVLDEAAIRAAYPTSDDGLAWSGAAAPKPIIGTRTGPVFRSLLDLAASHAEAKELKTEFTTLSDIYHALGASRLAVPVGWLLGVTYAVAGYTPRVLDHLLRVVFAAALMFAVCVFVFWVLHRARRDLAERARLRALRAHVVLRNASRVHAVGRSRVHVYASQGSPPVSRRRHGAKPSWSTTSVENPTPAASPLSPPAPVVRVTQANVRAAGGTATNAYRCLARTCGRNPGSWPTGTRRRAAGSWPTGTRAICSRRSTRP
jgi:hypothetical protein